MRFATITALILGGLPLLLYPFVFLAGVMSLGGHRTGDEPLLLMAVAYVCVLGSLVYPVVYGCCLVATFVKKKQAKERAALWMSVVPLVFLVLLGGLFIAWSNLE